MLSTTSDSTAHCQLRLRKSLLRFRVHFCDFVMITCMYNGHFYNSACFRSSCCFVSKLKFNIWFMPIWSVLCDVQCLDFRCSSVTGPFAKERAHYATDSSHDNPVRNFFPPVPSLTDLVLWLCCLTSKPLLNCLSMALTFPSSFSLDISMTVDLVTLASSRTCGVVWLQGAYFIYCLAYIF